MTNVLPLIAEPSELAAALDNNQLIILDLRDESNYISAHIPNAINFALSEVVSSTPPTGGLLPSEEQMSAALSRIGYNDNMHIVAVDDNGGPQAARLIWTLEAFGITQTSFLNGGMAAWLNDIGATDATLESPNSAPYRANFKGNNVASREYIQTKLGNDGTQLLDARTAGEYSGEDMRSARGGHISGAIHFEWSQIKDHNLKLKPLAEIESLIKNSGISPDKEIVAYCQTHMRSSVICLTLRALEYPDVKGYPGAWSDWGNQSDTPIE